MLPCREQGGGMRSSKLTYSDRAKVSFAYESREPSTDPIGFERLPDLIGEAPFTRSVRERRRDQSSGAQHFGGLGGAALLDEEHVGVFAPAGREAMPPWRGELEERHGPLDDS